MKITQSMETSTDTYTDVAVARVDRTHTISAGSARTIAGWWATPSEDSGMTQLAMGMEVPTSDVLNSIERNYYAELNTMATSDLHALEALRDWALHRDQTPAFERPAPVEERVSYEQLVALEFYTQQN